MSEKKLLIIERSGQNLDAVKSSDGSIILEGIFTQIGIRNKNNRIYEEREVLPHIQELQEKIKTASLLGELDHPKDYDISLANVSHVIEDLRYDQGKQQVIGRIRLLNTSKGKEAQALVNDGIPLNISSRAAGSVSESGKVMIKKWFTYDLVADPGFANAQLNRVNESFGFDEDDSLFIYEMAAETEEPTTKTNKQQKNKINEMNDFITKSDFNKYTEYLKNEITTLSEKLKDVSVPVVENSVEPSKFNKLIKYTEMIGEKVNSMVNYMDYIAENLDNSIKHNDHIVENFIGMKNYAKYLAETLDNTISYTEHIAEKSDQGIRYTERIAEEIESVKDYAEYIAEKTDNSISYSESIAEGVNKLATYADYISNKLEESIGYTEHVAEKTDQAIGYTEHIAEKTDQAIGYTGYLKENIENVISYSEHIAKGINESIGGTTQLTESTDYETDFKTKLTSLLEKVESTKDTGNKNQYHFMNLLNESKKNEFYALNENKQAEVVKAMNDRPLFSTVQAEQVWESVFQHKKDSLNLVSDMPEKYKAKWEALPDDRKNQILAESKFYPTTTQYQINNFWSTRDLRDQNVAFKPLHEQLNITDVKPEVTEINEDYRQSLIDKVKSSMKRYE